MTAAKIADDLQPLAVALDRLEPGDPNPRRGEVSEIARSYDTFGQRKPIVARQTDGSSRSPRGTVIAGNHQLAAAKQLGWDKIAVVWVKEDEAQANAFALADNRTSDIATYDDEMLLALLKSFDEDVLLTTGYTTDDIKALEVLAEAPDLDALADELGDPTARDGLRRVVLWVSPQLAGEMIASIADMTDHDAVATAWLNK